MGKDINAYFIGKGRRRVAFFGTHHASEHITCNVLFAFIDDLLHKAERRIGDAAAMLSLCTYVVVPMVNPDGAELAIHGIPEQSPLRERQMRMACGEMKKWNSNPLFRKISARFLKF